MFRPGRAYRNYVAHIKNACFLSELLLDRYTPSVIGIARGLKAAQYTSFRFHNVLDTADLFLIINELGWEGDFDQLFCSSFYFQ